jgi:choline dehydrogenase-like flavoprotein
MKNLVYEYDIVVIGSGPGGAVTFSELIEHGINSCLLEVGGEYQNNTINEFTIEELIAKYKHQGMTSTLGVPSVNYVEGQCFGGGSEVNSGLYHRTPDYLLKDWQERLNITDLDFKDIYSYFSEVEEMIDVQKTPLSFIPKSSFKLAEGATNLGWQYDEIPRWYSYKDKTPQKNSMSRTLLKKNKSNIFTEHQVTHLKKIKNHWNCFAINQKKNKRVIFQSKFIFLCTGSIENVRILNRSKISGNHGKQLFMHPSIKITALFDEKVNKQHDGVSVHQIKQFSPRIGFGCSISSKPYLQLALASMSKYFSYVEKNWQYMATYYAMISGGQGTVRTLPFIKNPLVNFKLNPTDISTLKEGLLKLGECLFAAGAKTLFPSVVNMKPIYNQNALEDFVRSLRPHELNLMTVHLFSTCSMGGDKKIATVDSYGKFYGFDNLYINDSSIIPTALGCNPQGTTMMLALRNIRHFIQRNYEK